MTLHLRCRTSQLPGLQHSSLGASPADLISLAGGCSLNVGRSAGVLINVLLHFVNNLFAGLMFSSSRILLMRRPRRLNLFLVIVIGGLV
mgnify:CR=1 FL=1